MEEAARAVNVSPQTLFAAPSSSLNYCMRAFFGRIVSIGVYDARPRTVGLRHHGGFRPPS